MEGNIIDLSQRPHEVAHSALVDVIQKWKTLGATDRQIGELLLANAVTYFWDGDNCGDLGTIVQEAAQAQVDHFLYTIGERRAPQ